jgi:hypothetical protein
MSLQKSVNTQCPVCKHAYRVKPKVVGHRARCSKCDAVFRVAAGFNPPTEEDILRWLSEADNRDEVVRPRVVGRREDNARPRAVERGEDIAHPRLVEQGEDIARPRVVRPRESPAQETPPQPPPAEAAPDPRPASDAAPVIRREVPDLDASVAVFQKSA